MGKKEEVPRPKQSLVHQLSEVVTGPKKQEQQKPQGLLNKINHSLGGGAKGEAEEDRLDKGMCWC